MVSYMLSVVSHKYQPVTGKCDVFSLIFSYFIAKNTSYVKKNYILLFWCERKVIFITIFFVKNKKLNISCKTSNEKREYRYVRKLYLTVIKMEIEYSALWNNFIINENFSKINCAVSKRCNVTFKFSLFRWYHTLSCNFLMLYSLMTMNIFK